MITEQMESQRVAVTNNLGRLRRVDLRDVWVNEATSFTPWLSQDLNLQLLGEAIGIDLCLEAQEQNVGPFRADLLCKDTGTDAWVLIENQIERTDHIHLGQLLTYAAGLSAVTIVWIAQRFTDEHRAALDWLNEVTNENISFFGLEIELWRIGDSVPAPKFNVVSKPNDFVKQRVAERSKIASGNPEYIEYWSGLRALAEENSKIIRPMKPLPQYWTNISIGRTGYHLGATASMRDKWVAVWLVIYADADKARIRQLEERRAEIDRVLPGIEWNEKQGRKSSALELFRTDMDPNNREEWPRQHQWMLENLEIMHRTLAPLIRELT